MSKYKAVKEDGFDSKMEGRFQKLLEKKGIVFEPQKRFLLQPGYELNGEKIKEINYICDFYLPNLELVIDVKGFETPDFKLKKKIFGKIYGMDIICLTECPNKYEEKKKGIQFEGWIEKKELASLRNKDPIVKEKRKKKREEKKKNKEEIWNRL